MTANEQQFSLFDLDLDPVVEDRKSATTPTGRFGNFIVYVDESGDHGMHTVDPNYPSVPTGGSRVVACHHQSSGMTDDLFSPRDLSGRTLTRTGLAPIAGAPRRP